LALVSWSYLTGMNVTSFPTSEVCTKPGMVQLMPKATYTGRLATCPSRILTWMASRNSTA